MVVIRIAILRPDQCHLHTLLTFARHAHFQTCTRSIFMHALRLWYWFGLKVTPRHATPSWPPPPPPHTHTHTTLYTCIKLCMAIPWSMMKQFGQTRISPGCIASCNYTWKLECTYNCRLATLLQFPGRDRCILLFNWLSKKIFEPISLRDFRKGPRYTGMQTVIS